MPFTSGQLRQTITIQARGLVGSPAAADAYGQTSGDWAAVSSSTSPSFSLENIPANVTDLQGTELYKAQALVAAVTAKIVLWGYHGWRADIKPDMRILSDGRIFDIKAITNPDGIDIELNILAKEIQA